MSDISLIEILEDAALSIYNSEYSKSIILIGGYALMSRIGDEFRGTKDLDFNVDNAAIWEDFCANAEDLLNTKTGLGIYYKVIKRNGLSNAKSDRLWLEADNKRFTI